MINMKRSLAVLLSLSLSACATYKGGTPDWSAGGEEAAQEVEDYTIKPGFYGSGTFEMRKETYAMASLRPLVNNVSARAGKSLSRALNLEMATIASLGAALAVIIFRGTDVKQADNF